MKLIHTLRFLSEGKHIIYLLLPFHLQKDIKFLQVRMHEYTLLFWGTFNEVLSIVHNKQHFEEMNTGEISGVQTKFVHF